MLKTPMKSTLKGALAAVLAATLLLGLQSLARAKDIVYLTPGLDLPFWRYLAAGVESVAKR